MKYEVESKERKRVEMDLQRLRGFRGRRIRVSIKSSSVSLSNKDCEVDSSDLWFLIGEVADSVIVPPPENHREMNLLWEICRMGFRFKIRARIEESVTVLYSLHCVPSLKQKGRKFCIQHFISFSERKETK
ncbi:hypothetical protein HanHA89_Chr04g0158151 [Helianthus annuus]|nr:hypothetical protein HanHA89_Chr04g0158151 [Helianthus annuus]